MSQSLTFKSHRHAVALVEYTIMLAMISLVVVVCVSDLGYHILAPLTEIANTLTERADSWAGY